MSDEKNQPNEPEERKLDAVGVLYVLGGIPVIAGFFVIYFTLVKLGLFSG